MHLYIPGIARCWSLDNTLFGLLTLLDDLHLLTPFRYSFYDCRYEMAVRSRFANSTSPIFGPIERGCARLKSIGGARAARRIVLTAKILHVFANHTIFSASLILLYIIP
jgi:hypothetical protein